MQNTASIFLHPLSAQLLVTSVRSVRTKVRSARTDVSKRQNNWIAEKRCCILQQPLKLREAMADMNQYGCVLLKGGKSSRMGGNDKSQLLYKGKSFEERIKKELMQLELPLFMSEAKKSGDSQVISDLIQGAGPLGGIYSCLKVTGLSGLFFVSCDMPLFHAYLGKRAVEEAEKEEDLDAVIWQTRDGRVHPVCGWYSFRCLPVLEKQLMEKNGKVRDLLGKLKVKILETGKEHVPDLWFSNVNTPMALSSLTDIKPSVFAVSGKKNTGKTTLTEALVKEFSGRGLKVAVIKHDGHDFTPDVPGTDSYRHKAAGACGTVVYSDQRFCLAKEEKEHHAEDFFPYFNDADLILLEGMKDSVYPKLEVMRREVSEKSVCRTETIKAYVTDFLPEEKPGFHMESLADCPVFDFHDIDAIMEIVLTEHI